MLRIILFLSLFISLATFPTEAFSLSRDNVEIKLVVEKELSFRPGGKYFFLKSNSCTGWLILAKKNNSTYSYYMLGNQLELKTEPGFFYSIIQSD